MPLSAESEGEAVDTVDAKDMAAAEGGTAGERRPAMRIAILDDDSGFVTVLRNRCDRLRVEHRVLAGPARVESIAAMRLNALVLDPEAAGLDAWPWIERLCAELPGLGVVICARRSTVSQRVRALRGGVDDWVTKPAHPEEVIARLESVTRRHRAAAGGQPSAARLLAGEVEVRADRFQAFVGRRSLELTRREFELISLLAAAEGRVLEREQIYGRLWGYAMVRGDRSVDVFVRKLRQKLEKASPQWRYIHTHFGIGYRFAAERLDARSCAGERGEHAEIEMGRGEYATLKTDVSAAASVAQPPLPQLLASLADR